MYQAIGLEFLLPQAKEKLKADLCAAISNIEKDLIEADLGGGVVKRRIP